MQATSVSTLRQVACLIRLPKHCFRPSSADRASDGRRLHSWPSAACYPQREGKTGTLQKPTKIMVHPWARSVVKDHRRSPDLGLARAARNSCNVCPPRKVHSSSPSRSAHANIAPAVRRIIGPMQRRRMDDQIMGSRVNYRVSSSLTTVASGKRACQKSGTR